LLIDFIESSDIDIRSIFVSGGNTIINPKLAERPAHRNILPDDMHFSSKQLLQLFLKPQYMVSFRHYFCTIIVVIANYLLFLSFLFS
jgi:condensin complex subunit 2